MLGLVMVDSLVDLSQEADGKQLWRVLLISQMTSSTLNALQNKGFSSSEARSIVRKGSLLMIFASTLQIRRRMYMWRDS